MATLPRSLADALYTARRPSAAVYCALPPGRPCEATWHVVGTRPDGTRVILLSRSQRRLAVRDARTLARRGNRL